MKNKLILRILLYFTVIIPSSAEGQVRFFDVSTVRRTEHAQSRYFTAPESDAYASIVTVKAKINVGRERYKINKRLLYHHFFVIHGKDGKCELDCAIALKSDPEMVSFQYRASREREQMYFGVGQQVYKLVPTSGHTNKLSRKFYDNGDGETIEIKAKRDLTLEADDGTTAILKRGSTFVYDVSSLSLDGYVLHTNGHRTWLTPNTKSTKPE